MWSRICDFKASSPCTSLRNTIYSCPALAPPLQKTALVETRVASELAEQVWVCGKRSPPLSCASPVSSFGNPQIASFNAAVAKGEGAVFFAVCRGKVRSTGDIEETSTQTPFLCNSLSSC